MQMNNDGDYDDHYDKVWCGPRRNLVGYTAPAPELEAKGGQDKF